MRLIIILFAIIVAVNARRPGKCIVVDNPKCPKGEVYKAKGPGPFCYTTCCGTNTPPCRLGSFTTGCFCENDNFIKKFPVTNNTAADPNNPCIPVEECTRETCAPPPPKCTKAHEEYRDCGPTNMCDNQVCRGMRPMCEEGEELICVAGCFCQPGYSRDGGECVRECPLYP